MHGLGPWGAKNKSSLSFLRLRGPGRKLGSHKRLQSWDKSKHLKSATNCLFLLCVCVSVKRFLLQILECYKYEILSSERGWIGPLAASLSSFSTLWKDHTEIAQTEEPLQRRKFHNLHWPTTQSNIYLLFSGRKSFHLANTSPSLCNFSFFSLALLSIKIENSWSSPFMFFMCLKIILNHSSWAQV